MNENPCKHGTSPAEFCERCRTPDALRSFYGRTETSLATGREQQVLTPLSVLERIPWWSEGVGKWAEIEETYYEPEFGDLSGLHMPWCDRTYVNPVFARLEEWLAAAVGEHVRDPAARIAMLVPVRTHRKWFRAALEHVSGVDMLDPVTFLGHDQPFPAPLWLLHFGG